jgi:PAS domain S-box-containing protein
MAGGTASRWQLLYPPALTLGAALFIYALSGTPYEIANPGVVFYATIAFAAARGGRRQGLLNAAIALAFLAWLFSVPGRTFQYSPTNVNRLALSALVFAGLALLVGTLGRRAERTFEEEKRRAAVEAELAEHKRSETALREGEARLRQVLDGLGPQMFVGLLTPEGTLIEANRPALELGGLDPSQVLGKPLEETYWLSYSEETKQQVRQAVERAARGEPSRFDMLIRARENQFVTVDFSLQPLFDKTGKIQYLVPSARDITERKRAEEALRESEAKFRAIADFTSVGLYFLNEEGRYVYVNPAAEKLSGYSRDELLCLGFFDLIHPDFHERVRQRWAARLRGEPVPPRSETKMRMKSGEERWVEFTASPVVLEGKRLWLGTVQDIHERKRAEEALKRQAEELSRLSGSLLRAQDEERRRLARELHDSFAQAVAAVRLNLGRVAEGAPGLNENAREALAEASETVGQLAEQIRTLSYLLHPPLLEELGLAAAVRSYAKGFSTRSGIPVAVQAPESLPRLDLEKETALFRVVQESLGNVQRHSGSPVAAIHIRVRAGNIALEVRDQGRGFQLVPDAAAEMGVGIPGMRERLRQLGGSLEVTSTGAGTIVRATLPIERSTGALAHPAGG